MTIFDRPADVISKLQADAGLARRVDLLVRQRFNLKPNRYRELFWLLLAEAACAGGRLVMTDLDTRAAERAEADADNRRKL